MRAILPALLAIGLWAIARYHMPAPIVQPLDAPAAMFSGERAAAAIARVEGPQVPHPASTPANEAERARLIAELNKLGVPVTTKTAMGCYGFKRGAVMGCATVTDVIAQVLPGAGKAIVMLAHYDSVPAGPGAADDGSGVATLLETIRVLKARKISGLHPVIALFTDGEEYGMLGAAAFLQDAALKAQTGVAINIEARGNQGPSRLFQLSPAPSKLIELYAHAVPRYAASSLYAEIYRFLPNDTDLSLFLRDGITSYNFAIADRLPHYHTPLDTLANLSHASLQDHGDNLVGLVTALEQTRFEALQGHAEIYLDVLGRFLPRIAQSWALPLSLLFLLILAVAGMAGARGAGMGARLAALLIVPAGMLGAALLGWLFAVVAQTVSGVPDPAYAYPLALRLSLAFGIAAALFACTRLANARTAAGGVWIGLALLGVAVAAYLPGVAPYFLLPLAAAAILLPLAAWAGFDSALGEAALFLAALVALTIWMQLVAQSETVMGLRLHPLFTIPAAIGLSSLVPLLAARPFPSAAWRYSVGGCFAAGLVLAAIAGFQAPFSKLAPQRLNINYLADAKTGKTQWAADASAPLPGAIASAAAFSKTADYPDPSAWMKAYLAPAPDLHLPMPAAIVAVNDVSGAVRRVSLTLAGHGDMMTLALPGSLKLTRVITGSTAYDTPAGWAAQKQVVISCLSRDCNHVTVTLEMTGRGAFPLTLIERSNHLPPQGAFLAAARPANAVQSQFGDGTLLISEMSVPAAK